MIYDFERRVDLTGFGSVKQEAVRGFFGSEELLPMWVADMDFPGPAEVVSALVRRAEAGIYGYGMRTDALNEAVVGWMARRHDWSIRPEWIQHSPGIVTALVACVRTFTESGDGIVIQPPVYPPFAQVVADNGRMLIANPLKQDDNGRYTMDLEDLRAKLQAGNAKMLILCSPHNPVGRVWTAEELRALADVCREFGVLIVSDEIHADLAIPPHRHETLAGIMGEDERWIVCIAPSKTFNMAGLQSSFVIIPNEELRAAFADFMKKLHLTEANSFALTAAEAAYRHGDEWLDQALAYISGNMDLIMDFASERLPGVRISRPEGTYLVWLDFRSFGRSPEELEAWMKTKSGVAMNVGSAFGAEGEGFLRLNAAAQRPVLEEALRRIAAALPALREG